MGKKELWQCPLISHSYLLTSWAVSWIWVSCCRLGSKAGPSSWQVVNYILHVYFRWKWKWTVWWTLLEHSVLQEYIGTLAQKVMLNQIVLALLFVLTMEDAKSWDMRMTKVSATCSYPSKEVPGVQLFQDLVCILPAAAILQSRFPWMLFNFYSNCVTTRSHLNWYCFEHCEYPVEPLWECAGYCRLPEGSFSRQRYKYCAVLHSIWWGKSICFYLSLSISLFNLVYKCWIKWFKTGWFGPTLLGSTCPGLLRDAGRDAAVWFPRNTVTASESGVCACRGPADASTGLPKP